MSCVYELRGSAHDLLHEVVREGLAGLRDAVAAVSRTLPTYVVRELEGFLRCGDPSFGFAWLVCDGCDHHRCVPFFCKMRGFCASCGGRRMAATAAKLVDTVFRRAPVRQFVLTVPWKRRLLLARSPKLAGSVLAVALEHVGAEYAGADRRRDRAAHGIAITTTGRRRTMRGTGRRGSDGGAAGKVR